MTEYIRKAIAEVRSRFVQPPGLSQGERWEDRYVTDLFGKTREGFNPEERFEFSSKDGNKIDTPVLDYLVIQIGFLDAHAQDGDLPQMLSSGEYIYRNSGALNRLVKATTEIVRMDAYPYSGTPETVASTMRPLPRFLDPLHQMAAFRHREYFWELFRVLRENPAAWLITDYGWTRVSEQSSLRTTDIIVPGVWQDIGVQKIIPHELVAD